MSTEKNNQPSAFQQLLGDLDTMAKAMPQPQAEGAPVAGEGEDDEAKKQAAATAAAAAESGDPMTKSFQVTLADGSVIEAQDGTELVKSLFERVDGQEDMMVKALGGTLDLVKSLTTRVTSQGEVIKSLQETVAKLGNQGAGRKTLVNVHEQVNSLTKSLPGAEAKGVSPEEFLAKSHAAFAANKISGQELNVIDVSLRQGAPIDQSLLAKVG
jgi:hypothetical protein